MQALWRLWHARGSEHEEAGLALGACDSAPGTGLGIWIGHIVVKWLCRDNGKENGNYAIIVYYGILGTAALVPYLVLLLSDILPKIPLETAYKPPLCFEQAQDNTNWREGAKI